MGDGAPAVAADEELVELSLGKRNLGLRLGLTGGVVAAIAAASVTILVAPGVLVGGVDMGWRTASAATNVVAAALAETVVTLQTASSTITFTGAQLGLSVDAEAVATLARNEHPLWNVGTWNPGNVPLAVDINADAAFAALSAAAPTVFHTPTNARVTYDRTLDEFTTTESASGYEVNFDGLATVVSEALSAGSREVTYDATLVRLEPSISDAEATTQVGALNDLIGSAGFYVDGARVMAIDPDQAASWLSVEEQGGALAVDVNTDAAMADMWRVVASLPRTVNRPEINELVVTNSAGNHLSTIQHGAAGWMVGATSDIAAAFVAAFAAGDSIYELDGQTIDYETTLLFRSIEVNKTTGQVTLYENGNVVGAFPVAVGRPSLPTPEGHFAIFRKLPLQNMGCVPSYDYCTPNVPWVSYFSGDNAFHGTYWHNNFGAGAMVSHGCVNMTIAGAERLFNFAPEGTEVWVHS